ncbi:MAG: septum formation initiator family protein [Bowdeniella nasicola]|nr:septum formation initiator family protein [Bowdeniella nasicola]
MGRGTYSLSWRTIIALVVLIFGLVIVLSPLQHFLQQREEMRALKAEVAEVQEQIAAYERDKARWQNPDFIAAQARDRLGWVLPGETPYVVVDPHTVTGEEPEEGPRSASLTEPADPPWYLMVVDSLEAAQQVEDSDE